MNQLVVQGLQWAGLQDISSVRSIDDSDALCLEEIRQILAKHDRLERFGVTLLHTHFDLADDEVLLETTDVAKREQWVRPVRREVLEAAGAQPQTTVLRFDRAGANVQCVCLTSPRGHEGRHGYQ